MAFGGSSTGITYAASGQLGKYWRIGKLVYFNVTISLTSKGSSTGNATITLPPIVSANDGIFQACATQSFLNTYPGSATYIIGEIPPASSSVNLVGCGANTQTAVTDVEFANNSEIQMSGFYWTT